MTVRFTYFPVTTSLIRLAILLISAVIFTVSLILLLNFTAQNPTGRRYSSTVPTLSGTPNEIGASAEIILADDLGLFKNTINFDGVIPDFVDDFYVIESKNCASLPCESRRQFERLIALATETNRELWIYTRVDTSIPTDMSELVRTTGGQIVGYFAVPGYVDPIDHTSLIGLIVASGTLAFVGTWELIAIRNKTGSFPVLIKKGAFTMTNDNRNRFILAGLILVALILVLDGGAIRSGLATIQSIAAIAFYLLGAYWFFKHLDK